MAAVRVLKFGGTSVGSRDALRQALSVVERAAARGGCVVVVVSALGGVTDELLAAAAAAAADTGDPAACAKGLRQRHAALLQGVASGRAAARASLELDARLEELSRLLASVRRKGTCAPRFRDQIAALGERLSAPVVVAGLCARGLSAEGVDASEIVRTDDSFGAARPDPMATRALVLARLGGLPEGRVPVVTGFLGATSAGETTTLGRGGSDLTAALIGQALGAERVEIWSDVDGVLTADPRLDPRAVTLPELSYARASQLARAGAKVLQPECVAPLEHARIPILVRNTLRPEGPGTWIGRPRPRVDVAVAGFRGQVARSLLARLNELEPEGVELRLVGAFQRDGALWDARGLSPAALLGGAPALDGLPWRTTLARLRRARAIPLVLVDCTASRAMAREYGALLGDGVAVVTPNKHAGCLPLAEYAGLRARSLAGAPWRYATTVGAGLPVLRTLREHERSGDRLTSLAAVLSGTLSFVLGRVQTGVAFSAAVAEAREQGLTEPDPREDLSGEDVARKLLIALRESGLQLERQGIRVESLVPRDGQPAHEADLAWAERAEQARASGERLAHVARWDRLGPRVGVERLPAWDPLARASAGENVIVIHSERYAQVPLTLAGPGAGRDVTAGGVLADLLSAAEELLEGQAGQAPAPRVAGAHPHGACY